jgi:hypothetical protein
MKAALLQKSEAYLETSFKFVGIFTIVMLVLYPNHHYSSYNFWRQGRNALI